MKKLLFAAVAALCLASCNKELGPEYTTAAEIGTIAVFPAVPTAADEVTITAPVTSLYGLHAVRIAYQLDGNPETAKFTTPVYYTKDHTSVTFKGTIPPQKAGTKVEYQVQATTPYSVFSFSELKSYTVQNSYDPDGGEQEEPDSEEK